MAKFIEVHFAVDGTPRLINVDSIFGVFPSVREEEGTRLNNVFDPSMTTYIYNKTSCDCARIEFKNDKYFDVRETYDEVYEKIKAATESDDTKKTSMDQSDYMVRGIE